MSPPGILSLTGLPAALAASQAAAGVAAGPAARAAMAAGNDGDSAGSQATEGYGDVYSPPVTHPLLYRRPPQQLGRELWRRGPVRVETPPPASPPATTPKISFSDSRRILSEQLMKGPLTRRKVYGQTVEVLGMRVTLRSVLTRFWDERRSQLIAEGKLNNMINEDPLNEEVLDIIHFDLTGKLRVRSRWNSDHKKKWIALKLAPGQFMSNADSLEGAYSLLRLISRDRRVMKGAQRFPSDKGGTIIVYNPNTGQFVQYEQLLKTAHARIARAIAGRDYRVALFGTYDREKPDPRQPVYGPSGVSVAARNLPFVERAVNRAVVQGLRPANIPSEELRTRMWQWVQQYGDQLPRRIRPVIRRGAGGRQPVYGLTPAQWSPSEMGEPFPLEMGGARMVGMPRDSHGILSAHLAWANVAGSYLLARMSDGMGLAIPPPPPSPLGTPLAARLIREDGKPSMITIAQSPKEASESVNGPLAAAATRALQWWRLQRARGNLPQVHEVIDWVARRLRDSGRDLHHPALLAEDQDLHRPGWVAYLDIFVQTDQFFKEDVPQVLSLLEVELQAANDRHEHGATETLRTLRAFRRKHHIPAQLPPGLQDGSGNGYTVGGLRMILTTVMRRYAQLPPN